jgi:hypothetical protein
MCLPITAKHAPLSRSINKIQTNHSETNNFCPHEYEMNRTLQAGLHLGRSPDRPALRPPHLTLPIITHPPQLVASSPLSFSICRHGFLADQSMVPLCSSASGLKKPHRLLHRETQTCLLYLPRHLHILHTGWRCRGQRPP